MATFGRSDTSANNFYYENSGSNNQVGTRFTAPENGVIQSLSVYFAMNGTTGNAALCLWDTSGNLLAQTATFTCVSGSTGINNQTLQTHNLTTPYAMTGGTSYIIGFWRDPAKDTVYSTATGSGRTDKQGATNIGSPGTLSLSNSVTEQMTAYATYTTATIHRRSGTSWASSSQVSRRSGGAWANATNVYRRKAGVWTDAT